MSCFLFIIIFIRCSPDPNYDQFSKKDLSFLYFDKHFDKSNILLNEKKILRTRFFKQICGIVKSIEPEKHDAEK